MNSVEKVLDILNERKIPVSRLERDLKFGNGYIKQLRKGEIPAIRLMKIAHYLNVPVKQLMPDGEVVDLTIVEPVKDNKKTAAPKDDGLADAQSELIKLVRQLDPDGVHYLKEKAQGLIDFQQFRDGQ